ncbi:MAG: YihY/virulence factor BrkB family protein [Candidatus Syntrophonatronum acetioxidans]|uniref:YihY/virulence factor BrkB family protein n=1 Tax=Candidatus Syntrophonatronum acetioxidans TaxID=1795816 RepID=A0A424YAL1_9FIRM|nr:MAG: YihY/virulence factor BrkB family protein [Candidatus Syntrophonatronum acetioxidans]
MGFKKFKQFFLHLVGRVRENETTALAAQLSYFLILSVFPFLIFLLTLITYTPLTQQHILQQLALLLPDTAYNLVRQIVWEVFDASNATLLSVGFLATFWSASRSTFAVIRGINKAYGAKETRSFIKLNIIGIIITLALAVIIIFTLSLLVFGRTLGIMAFETLGLEETFYYIWPILRYLIPLLIIFAVFSFLYAYSPNVPLRFKNVYVGAIFATLGWVLASQVFAFYVNNFAEFTRTYGSLGGIIIFLLWLYISSIVILMGGEINATLAHVKTKS